MWWLYVLIGLVLIIATVLLSPARLTLEAGAKTEIDLRVLFIKKRLYPQKDKKQKKKQKKKKSEKPAEKKSEKPRETDGEQAMNTIGMIKDIVLEVLRRARTIVRVTLKRLYLVIATDEAAKTAVIYGAAANAYDELAEVLRRTSNYREKAGAVTITTDFTSEKTVFSIIVEFRTNLLGALRIVLPAIIKNIKTSDNNIIQKGKNHG
ncbi:MAG: hypothetical protein IJQ37_02985 [Clostridia bacterium]|nr:hypothetical protein [Clostridia bacterium]